VECNLSEHRQVLENSSFNGADTDHIQERISGMKRKPRLLDKAFQRVVKSTMIQTNVLKGSGRAAQSPMGSDLTD